MEKQPIFEDNVHEYDYSYNEEKRTYILYYSEGEQWTSHCRGEIALKIKDTGNGLKIKSLGKKNYLDYSEAVYLDILLRIIHKEYKIERATITKEKL